jgi:hypothetical protein
MRRTAPLRREEETMEFLVSLITDGTSMSDATPEEMKELGERMGAFMGELQGAGALLRTGRLGPSVEAKTLRYGKEGKPVITDGPFAETKEQVAGYMILECKDLDEAIGWAERMPVRGSSVEVRPIVDSAQRSSPRSS